MITRLRVKGFKSLYDLDVTLTPLTVLFGANTSGKSNVLDVIQLLARSVTAEHIADIFDAPFRGTLHACFSQGHDGLVPENAKIEISVDLIVPCRSETSDLLSKKIHKKVRYELALGYASEGFASVLHESLYDLSENKKRDIFPSSFNRKEGTFLGTFTKQGGGLGAEIILKLPSQDFDLLLSVAEDIKGWQVFALDPQDGLRSVNEPFRQNAKLGPKGEKLASFLYVLKIKDPFQWETFQKALHLYIPEITAVDVVLNQHGELDLYVQEGNKKISSRLMSDGTLTLMGLLAMGDTNNPRGVIAIDEPENGLHPSKMGLLARLLETHAIDNQQIIVTTHSPYLLDHMPLDAIYACQKENGKTNITPVNRLAIVACLDDEILLSDLIVSGALNA